MTYISDSVSSRCKLFCTDNIVSHVMSLIGTYCCFVKSVAEQLSDKCACFKTYSIQLSLVVYRKMPY